MGLKIKEKLDIKEEQDQPCPAACYYPRSTSPLDLSRTSTTFPFFHSSSENKEEPSSPMEPSSKLSTNFERQMSCDFPYETPEILIQPKSEWHYRNIKDLANKHIPQLSGIGPQRTPIRVKLPANVTEGMYLCTEIVTVDGNSHPSKVIVPIKTKVNSDLLNHDNRLDCLMFDECNPCDRTYPEERRIFSLITSNECELQQKDIRIYMFNLYQNQFITKEMIEDQKLYQCQLSFRICCLKDDQFYPLSDTCLSHMIHEKRTNVRTRDNAPVTTSNHVESPYSMFDIHNPIYQETPLSYVLVPIAYSRNG